MPSSELIKILRTGSQGLDCSVRFLILDACDRLERQIRDNELLMNKIVELRSSKEKTNADRIRAMSDEELAKWLLEVMKHKVACFGEGAFKYTPCRNVEHDCVKCGVEWLKQPVEDDNG